VVSRVESQTVLHALGSEFADKSRQQPGHQWILTLLLLLLLGAVAAAAAVVAAAAVNTAANPFRNAFSQTLAVGIGFQSRHS